MAYFKSSLHKSVSDYQAFLLSKFYLSYGTLDLQCFSFVFVSRYTYWAIVIFAKLVIYCSVLLLGFSQLLLCLL